MTRSCLAAVTVAATTAGLLIGSSSKADAAITTVDLGIGRAAAINNRGTVVGVDRPNDFGLAVKWDLTGHRTEVRTLPGYTNSDPEDINARGTIAGDASITADSQLLSQTAVRWEHRGRIAPHGPTRRIPVQQRIQDQRQGHDCRRGRHYLGAGRANTRGALGPRRSRHRPGQPARLPQLLPHGDQQDRNDRRCRVRDWSQ